MIDGLETFGFEFRQFMYNFDDKKDHDEAFCGWPLKTNMPYSMQYGMMTVGDILRFLDTNYSAATLGKDVYARTLFAADNFLRKKVTKAYQYNDTYNFHSRREMMQAFASLRDDLANAYGQKMSLSAEMANLFQTENGQSTQTSNYWPSGFELEFYVPEEYKDYGKLIN